MREPEIREWLQALRSPASHTSNGWVRASCPFALWRHQNGTDVHPSFGVKIMPSGASPVFCFACGISGNQLTMLFELRNYVQVTTNVEMDFVRAVGLVEAAEGGELAELISANVEEIISPKLATKTLHPFPELWLASFQPAWENEQAKVYLEHRQVPGWMMRTLGIRWYGMEKRVCFPIRGYDEKLYGLHGRRIDGGSPVYRVIPFGGRTNMSVWLGENMINEERPVVLVEGMFDYARVAQLYWNTLASLSASVRAKLKRISWAMRIYTLYDRDKAGDLARSIVQEMLPGSVITHLQVPEGYKDPGETPLSALTEVLKPHLDLDSK